MSVADVKRDFENPIDLDEALLRLQRAMLNLEEARLFWLESNVYTARSSNQQQAWLQFEQPMQLLLPGLF
jgi:hypothetical protein